jgi:hypothetical protein
MIDSATCEFHSLSVPSLIRSFSPTLFPLAISVYILLPAHPVCVTILEVPLPRVEIPRPAIETQLGGLGGK